MFKPEDIPLIDREDFPTLLPLKKAAETIGIEYRRLLDGVNDGTVPGYRLGKSRTLVRVPEVIAIMKTGGGHHE